MTKEEATALAKMAWPDRDPYVGLDDEYWGCLIYDQASGSDDVLLRHADRARFESALRMLAGAVDTVETAYQRGLDDAEDAVLLDYSDRQSIHRAFERLRNPPKEGQTP